ncbi:MAG: ATP-binding protein [Opitutales bacterium]
MLLFTVMAPALLCSAEGRAEEARLTERRVLVLNSYHLTYSWSARVLDEIVRELLAAGLPEEALVVRYFDSVRLEATGGAGDFAAAIFKSVEGPPFDLIIVQDDYALARLDEVYAEQFRAVPVVYCGVSHDHPLSPLLRAHSTGVLENPATSRFLEGVRALQPGRRKLVVFHGANPTALSVAGLIREEAANTDLEITWLDGRELTEAEMRTRIAALPPESILLSAGWKYGRDQQQGDLHGWLVDHCPVPFYLTDHYIDYPSAGVNYLGVSRLEAGFHGRQAAVLAVQILRGTSPHDLPVVAAEERTFFVRERAARAHGLVTSAISPHVQFVDRPLPWHRQHRHWLLLFAVMVAALLVGTGLGAFGVRWRRRRQMERLSREREQFHSLFHGLRDWILVSDAAGTILYLHAPWGSAFVPRSGEMLGRPVAEFEGGEEDALTLRPPGGEPVPVEKYVCPVTFDGVPAEMRVYHDLTRVREHEDEMKTATAKLEALNAKLFAAFSRAEEAAEHAEEANAAKSRFLANMSHEIRTPLNAILALTELLIADSREPAAQADLQTLRETGQHLLSVMNSLLDVAKIEAQEIALEVHAFQPLDLFQQAIEIVRSQARKADLALVASGPEASLPRVLGDPVRLRQVLLNLLTNAIKFTPQGRITVALEAGAPSHGSLPLCFRISDTGIGIEEAAQKRIVEPFYQTDAGISRSHAGTGLGLAISRQLAEIMGGSLEVTSEVGKGTTFLFRVPLALAPEEVAEEGDRVCGEREASGAKPGPALKVLVVDDSAVNRNVVARFLRRLGAEAGEAADGYECLHMTATAPYGLIFMDVQMPGLDGLEATRRLRERGDGQTPADVPIVALTAHAMKADRVRCLAAGMNDYLTKPVSREALRRTLVTHGLVADAAGSAAEG